MTVYYKDFSQSILIDELVVYFILDNKKTLEFNGLHFGNIARETIVLNERLYDIITVSNSILLSRSNLKEIASANSIEFSIRFNKGIYNGIFSLYEMISIKGFYNAVFDNKFELDLLYNNIPKEKSGCYIATMVYGSYSHPKVVFLRFIRDSKLSKSALGRSFINVYYKYSPRLVARCEGNYIINELFRIALNLIINILKMKIK